MSDPKPQPADLPPEHDSPVREPNAPAAPVKEPPAKPDPTRFGDWEMNGRCIDF
jgi:hypothetical protein